MGKSEQLTVAEIRDVTSEIAWISREAGERTPEKDMRPDDDIDKELFGLVPAYSRAANAKIEAALSGQTLLSKPMTSENASHGPTARR
ncbi:hypothetical protein ETD86_17345 [Nonomuraea turkmeniaca]|uniref:Uncharacterized protein n=1 Tax=Nonomuraea turkmeniaca TaxID=103838 RepID=A0A5S4FJG8_9ACTN|nr:hypothetical protein [Nonomuraea turkmeniaca]TMR20886.1 hypothetical protein ETD86_17345 [Nonomuraea turkmeniaca]